MKVRCTKIPAHYLLIFFAKKKKNPPHWEDASGRPGSNRPPRPWQGRALPNELLPLIKELRGAKIRIGLFVAKKNKPGLFILWCIKRTLRNNHIRFALVALLVQFVTAA